MHWIKNETPKAIKLGEKALALAEKTGDFACQIATMLHLGIYFFTIGDYNKQIKFHQEIRKRLTGPEAFQQHGMASFPGAWSRSHLLLGMAEL
ncbi:hypothetical protein GWN26_12940, partial [Candidatus Saccharibacteria bacterium]|nr:hypothetical protein [Candidatus Saccharibacteria bacterium]